MDSESAFSIDRPQRAGRPGLAAAGCLAAAWLLACGPAQALDYGPFSLTGFAKVDVTRGSNQCPNCQLFPKEDKQRFWADEILPGASYGTETTTTTLVQPYLGANFNLGGGFKLHGLLSQRWRDWKEDIPGYLYEGNVAVSHEAYGRLTVGAMTTRGWALADYPYGADVGLAEEWSSAGAGYGLLDFPSIRYTSPIFDVAGGDLSLEVTYSAGDTDFKINKPRFWEFWASYRHGDLTLDFVGQDSKNGNPQAWGHGPFTSLTPFPADDDKLGGSSQSIAMLMGRYIIDSNWEVLGGVRANRWSGAYAVVTTPGGTVTSAQWNNMFNVDWGGSRNGVPNPGYSARSTDFLAGLRYRWDRWIFSAGAVYLGKASTDNPSERGQSNSATIGTLGALYNVGWGLNVYGLVGAVRYSQLGLSPMSMPTNSAFTDVDSRVTKNGNWITVGAVFVF
jgi:predicted porin